MENNEISMFMDVKLDIYEKKTNASKLKNWSKCQVKIEAIKCFPCYIRITFIKIHNESQNYCVRIHLPGLSVYPATSRTKTYSYGLFWKQNRKKCCIFFALESQICFEQHMKWMKESINNLELYRQEFIETRRNSQYNYKHLQVIRNSEQNDNPKQNLQNILGPLPEIPNISESINWSRRVSGISDIYEEIPDLEHGSRNSRRISCVSVASGIYEEMRPIYHFKEISEEISEEGPPLPPPRKRLSTFENENEIIPRCNTNPEVELAKKKKYLTVLETVFSRAKRSESVSESKVSTKEDLLITPNKREYDSSCTAKSKRKEIFCGFNKTCRKRNSFSSPDLTNINLDEFDDFVNLNSLSSQFCDSSVSTQNIARGEEKSSSEDNKIDNNSVAFNISEHVQSDFNFSCNSSTINLVGANVNYETPELVEDVSGYCFMAPIRKNKKISFDDSENKENTKILGKDNEQLTADGIVYESMSPIEYSVKNDNSENVTIEDKHTYQNVVSADQTNNDEEIKIPQRVFSRESMSFDEKIPSYYPNNYDLMKNGRRLYSSSKMKYEKTNICHMLSGNIGQIENLYISPFKIMEHRRKLDCIQECGKTNSLNAQKTPLKAYKISENMYTVTKLPKNSIYITNKTNSTFKNAINTTNNINSLISSSSSSSSSLPYDVKNQNSCGKNINKEHATLVGLSSPQKYFETPLQETTSAELGSVRKFSSLPRLKKIDFSPLKLKINSVLQRHHSSKFQV